MIKPQYLPRPTAALPIPRNRKETFSFISTIPPTSNLIKLSSQTPPLHNKYNLPHSPIEEDWFLQSPSSHRAGYLKFHLITHNRSFDNKSLYDKRELNSRTLRMLIAIGDQLVLDMLTRILRRLDNLFHGM